MIELWAVDVLFAKNKRGDNRQDRKYYIATG
jgi:hypothetical protein